MAMVLRWVRPGLTIGGIHTLELTTFPCFKFLLQLLVLQEVPVTRGHKALPTAQGVRHKE